MRAVSASSEHPLATQALGECAGELLEKGAQRPDVVWLFTTPPHVGVLEDLCDALARLLAPGVIVGAVADTVVGGAREMEGRSAMSLLACWDEGPADARVRAHRIRARRHEPEPEDLEALRDATGMAMVLVDRPSLPPAALLDALARVAPGLRVVGAGLDPPSGRHAGVLVHDGELHHDGAVVVQLDTSATAAEVVVSQGVRPVGEAIAVTAAERRVLIELGGRPAEEHLRTVIDALDEGSAGVELLLAEVLESPGAPDELLVHHLLGRDRARGALALDAEVSVGSLVRVVARDGAAAAGDLVARLGVAAPDADAAWCVIGTGRGWPLFGSPDVDASTLSEHVRAGAVAGLVAASPFGTVAGRHHLVPRGVAAVLLG